MRFSTTLAFSLIVAGRAGAQVIPPDTGGRARPDTALSALGLRLNATIETKLERNRNERCTASQVVITPITCRGGLQPIFDVQFDAVANGSLADRFHLDVDYDSQREFDASNNISLFYQGLPDEWLRRVEVGNVTFTPPNSRFITRGVPSGNYGLQAITQFDNLTLRLIAAQQKGNVRQAQVFTIGDRTVTPTAVRLEDFRFEPRRFFFTIDPALLPGYPNIDILDTQRMVELAATLPETLQPTKIHLYRLRIGGQAPNPNGPRFIPRGSRNENRGPAYELLREGVHYIVDPSQLWVALVQPLSLDERLVVAYNVLLGDGSTVHVPTGGTPDFEALERDQFANLLWDSQVTPSDSVFNREIRGAYRLGGDELQRSSLTARIVTGTSGDQEKPVAGAAETYLEMFGLAQSSNNSALDVENRVWPRVSDPNHDLRSSGAGQKLIRDYFLVFPSLEPFAQGGLVTPGNPSNDTLYTTPTEDMSSPRRPQAVYQIVALYSSEGTGGAGTIQLPLQLRRFGERVELDGRLLAREVDYAIDYDLGRLTLNRPDTLLLRPRQLVITYEENPLFAEQPTTIFGLSSELAVDAGTISVTAIQQQQRSPFNRPALGYEAAGSLVAGMSTNLAWDAAPVTSFLQRFIRTDAPSRFAFQAEFAMSRPDPNATNRAFLESFEGEGGVTVFLADARWYFSSQPRFSASLPAPSVDSASAATLSWQNTGIGRDGELVGFRTFEIDPNTRFVGGAFGAPETMLWLTLFPLSIGGGARGPSGNYQWTIPGAPTGPRWRSIRTVLSPTGVDLTRAEYLEAWMLIDTSAARRGANPTLVVDIGEISENSLTFSPDTMLVVRDGASTTATGFLGKRFQGVNTLDRELDPFTLTFDAGVNDIGLPGDRADRLVLRDAQTGAGLGESTNVAICRSDRSARAFGDTRINCTVANDRPDDEDIDLDNVLGVVRDNERILRFRIDLGDPANYTRVGGCIPPTDPRNLTGAPVCWVQFRLPFASPTETLGSPSLRRMKAVRLTLLSRPGTPDDAFISLPLARLRLSGAPWLKRTETAIHGIGGERPAGGYVIATSIGTQDSTAGLVYQSPPGVAEEAESEQAEFGLGQVQINERSLRLLAGGLDVFDRAETYYRFPEGEKSFLGYEQLRVWARGRGNGWGSDGALQFYIKIGRDPDNFYVYRTPVNTGVTQQAWEPEVRIDFSRFLALQAEIQNAALQGSATISSACTAVDSALIQGSLPSGSAASTRYAACDGGYMVFAVDPRVNPPSLIAVQELAVGMVRVAPGTLPVPSIAGDTLELWVDDIRLTGVVDEPGYAGYIGADLRLADLVDVRVNLSRRDQNFRQLAEQPTFNTQDALDVASTLQLGKLLPQRLGLAAPLTISHRTQASDPYLLSRSDILAGGIAGLRTPRTAATQYSLTLRRSTPLDSSLFGPLFNNLTVATQYSTARSRSEYQTGEGDNFTASVDFNIGADPRTGRIPGWLDRALQLLPGWLQRTEPLARFREAEFRYTPSQFRVSSAVAHATDDRKSFTTPAASATDVGRQVRGLNYVLRNTVAIEVQPVRALLVRWDVNSMRDLRDYGDTSAAARAATSARRGLLGADFGLERERNMNGAIILAPTFTSWLRPRAELRSEFLMTRDPNARSLTSAEDGRLPRRLNNLQSVELGGSVELASALRQYLGGLPGVMRGSQAFLPVTISYVRTLRSSFDRASEMPAPSFQFALGDVDDFRELEGQLATSAGLSNAFAVSNTVRLPLGFSVTNQFSRTDTRNWTRRLQTQHSVLDVSQRTFPDLSLRWAWQPPAALASVLSAVNATGRVTRTARSTLAPPLIAGADIDRTAGRQTTYPLYLNAQWELFGGFSTTGSYSVSLTEDVRPGSSISGTSHEYGANLGKTFGPQRWLRLSNDVRSTLSWQRSQTDSRVMASGNSSRLTDNGRYTVSLSMDSDLSETSSFTFLGSRTVTFDENFNRRNTLTVISAVMSLRFFGGNMR